MILADPLVWLKFVQGAGFVALAALMWAEPMRCGGKNRPFHTLLAALFAFEAVEAAYLSWVRVELLQGGLAVPGLAGLLAVEALVAVGIYAAVAHLAYQVFRWRAYNAIKPQRRIHGCDAHFTP